MATKLQLITELANTTSKELSSVNKWTEFLSSAAWQYKYSFEDQVLIYAQRPDARACADFDTWNEKLKRRINRGAKGIALLRERGADFYLDHVFDVSDTYRGMRGVDVKLAGVDDETVQDVVVIDDAKKQKLKDVFWDMHTITKRTETVTSGETSEIVLYITITAKTKDEMISEYGFTRKQKEALETLLENADGFIGTTQSLAISDATAQDVIDNLPDSLSAERKNVVKKACSLVGKLTYFWGGKSSAIGWDSEWGKMKLVTAEGSRSSGCMRPYGLDCSGFVTWTFHNAGFSESAIGHGTSTQVSKGTRISLSSAQPGDLAFYNDTSHVGIVGGKDASGNVIVIHCSSGYNNVVVTTGGFGFAVRPNCY